MDDLTKIDSLAVGPFVFWWDRVEQKMLITSAKELYSLGGEESINLLSFLHHHRDVIFDAARELPAWSRKGDSLPGLPEHTERN